MRAILRAYGLTDKAIEELIESELVPLGIDRNR